MWLHLPEVLISLAFDLIIGDPDTKLHPVRLMGLGIEYTKRVGLRWSGGLPFVQVLSGAVSLGILCCITYISIHLFCQMVSFIFGMGTIYYLIIGFMCSFSFAINGLYRQTAAVLEALPDLDRAKERLSMIVGRDTDRLDEPGILRATIETLSENLSDSIVAPLFYLFIGGPPLAFFYRMVNTFDAMVGYKDPENRYFGLVPARADDLMNLIPSRLTALVLIFAGILMKPFYPRINPLNALKTTCRDARKHPSPNAGYPEAAMGCLLGIRLLGPMFYHGVKSEKPFLNPEGRDPAPEDFFIARKLSTVAILVVLTLFSILWYLLE